MTPPPLGGGDFKGGGTNTKCWLDKEFHARLMKLLPKHRIPSSCKAQRGQRLQLALFKLALFVVPFHPEKLNMLSRQGYKVICLLVPKNCGFYKLTNVVLLVYRLYTAPHSPLCIETQMYAVGAHGTAFVARVPRF